MKLKKTNWLMLKKMLYKLKIDTKNKLQILVDFVFLDLMIDHQR